MSSRAEVIQRDAKEALEIAVKHLNSNRDLGDWLSGRRHHLDADDNRAGFMSHLVIQILNKL